MAIINCPECGKEVSDSAQSCPNCGYEIKKHFYNIQQEEQKEKQRQNIGNLVNKLKQPKIIRIIIVIVIIAVLGVGIKAYDYSKNSSGYFDDITWDTTYKEVLEKYKEYNNLNKKDYSTISFWVEDYSYYGVEADAWISIKFKSAKVNSINVILVNGENLTERVRKKLDKYYKRGPADEVRDYIFISKNSTIGLYGGSSDDSLIIHYDKLSE